MSAKIVAILDRPSPRSFGMAPLLVRSPDGYRVLGLANGGPRKIEEAEAELALEGRCYPIELEMLEPDADLCAGWLGRSWIEDARALGLDPLRRPALFGVRIPSTHEVREKGRFYLGPPRAVYAALQGWVELAGRRFLREDGSSPARARIARLMRWTLPDDPRTMAVMVESKVGDERRERLELYVRRRRDAGRPASPEELESELEAALGRLRPRKPETNRVLPVLSEPPLWREAA